MSPDPYINKLLDAELPCKAKTVVSGSLNCILHARAEKRGLELSPFPSRAVIKHEIHELIITAEEQAAPGTIVNKIAYLGFFEIEEGGILWVGDRVDVDGKTVGELAGYDMAHFPNHMNIVVKVKEPLITGYEAGLKPGASITFTFVKG
jgi:hypothetical protein